MKLSFIASLICLSVVGCAATPPPAPLPPRTVTISPLPPPTTKGEMVEGSLVIVEVIEVESLEALSPEDYQALSSLIHRETNNIKCVCVGGDPHCHCKLPNGPKKLPQE